MRIKILIGSLGAIGASLLAAVVPAADEQAQRPPLAPLPPVPVPADAPLTPERVELGKMLFFDTRLSGDGSISCADCHHPSKGWGDGNDLSRGYPGTVHWRNSQTVVNSAYLDAWFWTGSAKTLEAQAKSAMTGPLAGNMNTGLAEERLKQVPDYVELFQEVYGEKPSIEAALSAIAAFERTVVSDDSPFDRYMRGDKAALTEQQLRGKTLFEGKAGCTACHNGPLLTDQQFHNIGVPTNPAFETDPQRQIAMRERMKSKGVEESVYLKFDRDPGLFLDSKKDEDLGKFRTPPLRYLAYTAPYMHNGAFFTIEEVVDFYDRGGDEDPFGTKSGQIKKLGLTPGEKTDLITFLESLSGDEVIVEPPKLPAYRALEFPMDGQW
jgi:cytochrome c peroxidase